MTNTTSLIDELPRIICWFSCGAASAVAAKLVLQSNDERKLGYAICKTEAGSKNRDGRPVFLDELRPNQGRKYKDEPPIKCGIICEGATA